MPTPQSLALIERAARAGRPRAMANYGLALHQRGEHAKALGWSQRAWDAGNVGAGFNLGTLYQVQGETNRAEVIWQKAAALGDVTQWSAWYASRSHGASTTQRLAGSPRCSAATSRLRSRSQGLKVAELHPVRAEEPQ
jgi:TPR repeat protein